MNLENPTRGRFVNAGREAELTRFRLAIDDPVVIIPGSEFELLVVL